jgi:Ca2+-binding RTX toxin-like protein
LDGGTGNDKMTGGPGADTFKAGEGDDHITDYSHADGDVIDISDVFEPGDYLAASDDGSGHVKLTVFDSSDIAQGTVTFENIDHDSSFEDDINNLVGPVIDVDDGTT